MAISDELTRIQTAKADIKASIEAKGVTVPSSALIDEYADYVDEISGGGGGQAEQDLIDLIERQITSLTIPSGTTIIGSSAFQVCTTLTSVTIPNSVTSIGISAFSNCSSLKSVTIPDSVTSISNTAFGNCSSLTSITIGSGVTSIGDYAFQSCSSLTSVTIPDSIKKIGGYSFRYCNSLTSLTINATTPPTLGANALVGTNANLVIYVPAASLNSYKTTGNWSTYASRIEAIPNS